MDNNLSNIAVVGSGYWGKNLVRNFESLGALHTICDTDTATLLRFKEQYPGVNTVSDFSEVLANPDISGIAIATPAETHEPLARQALLAGKDVYIEKPLCLSEEEGVALNTLAQEQGRVLMVGHLLWYHPVVLKLKKMVDSGDLGRIQYIYSNRLNLGKLRREENVLWSFAPHDISVILGLTGEMPETIRAQGGNYLHQKIADTTMTLMSFSSGIKAHIFVSWLHPFKEQKLVVVGEKQMAVFDDVAPWDDKLLLYPHSIEWNDNVPVANKADAVRVSVEQDEPLKAECAHFMECIEKRSRPRTDGEEGLRVLQVLNRCQESLEKERQVCVVPTTQKHRFFKHDSAVVDSGVEVGVDSKIWHFSHILSGSQIGSRCNIGQNVVVGPNVSMGNRCKIQNNVSVYEGVSLEDDVFCGPSMVFTNVMNPRAAISRKDEFCKTVVRKGVTFGANSTVVGDIEIGEYAFIGAGSVVTKDVPAYALMVGNPARQTGWMSKYGKKMDLALVGDGVFTCPFTEDKYILNDGHVSVEAV
jgi:UDP-2-acetamido-3-amino-2,3-dideoxy-glucuronate N-acetyltransferase